MNVGDVDTNIVLDPGKDTPVQSPFPLRESSRIELRFALSNEDL